MIAKQQKEIETLMYQVLKWVERMKAKKEDKGSIEELIAIYRSLDDQANMNFHIQRLQVLLEEQKEKEKYFREKLALRYEMSDERIFDLGMRPNKGVGLSLYEQKMIVKRVMR